MRKCVFPWGFGHILLHRTGHQICLILVSRFVVYHCRNSLVGIVVSRLPCPAPASASGWTCFCVFAGVSSLLLCDPPASVFHVFSLSSVFRVWFTSLHLLQLSGFLLAPRSLPVCLLSSDDIGQHVAHAAALIMELITLDWHGRRCAASCLPTCSPILPAPGLGDSPLRGSGQTHGGWSPAPWPPPGVRRFSAPGGFARMRKGQSA